MKKQTNTTPAVPEEEELFVAEELTSEEVELVSEKLDKPGEEDSDVNNDSKEDSQDSYIKNRREVIAKAMKESASSKKKSAKMEGEDEEEEEEESDEEEEEEDEEDEESVKESSVTPTITEAQSEALKELIKKLNAVAEWPEGHKKESELNRLAHEFAKTAASEKGSNLPTREGVEIDMSDDISALVEGETDLSEDFKTKAQLIFESAVNAKIKEITKEVVSESDAKIKEITKEILRESEKDLEESVDFIIDQVNRYLDHVVEEWMEENKLAVESGLRTEIAEEFIGNLKNLFQEHYIEVPESKTDLVQELADQVEALKTQINEVTEQNLELHQKQKHFAKKAIVEDSCSDLSLSQQEKLKALVEDVEFADEEQFVKKVNLLKKSYFSTKSGVTALTEESAVDTLGENVDTSKDVRNTRPSKMDMYVKALESGVIPGSNLFGGK